MVYKVFVTSTAKELLVRCLDYLRNVLMSPLAAAHLLSEFDRVIERLSDNPFQFPLCSDMLLKQHGYREALIRGMRYRVVFRAEGNTIYIIGIYNTLENYANKINKNYLQEERTDMETFIKQYTSKKE